MGMGEEMLIEQLIDSELWLKEQLENIEAGIWTTSDGEEIQIRDMRQRHIQSCLRMIKKGVEEEIYDGEMECVALAYLDLFEIEMARRFPPQYPAFADG